MLSVTLQPLKPKQPRIKTQYVIGGDSFTCTVSRTYSFSQIDKDFLIRCSNGKLYSALTLMLFVGFSRFEHIVCKAYRCKRDVYTYKHRSLSVSIDFVSR